MSRFLTVGAAQMGPIQRSHTRHDVVERMIAHLGEAKRMGCELVVFPELTLTTFFPRWWMPDQAEIDSFFEHEMPSNETAPLFTEAKRLGLGMSFGYAELANEGGRVRHFNTSIIVERDGRIAGKYRKVHLPGHSEHEPERPFQHLVGGTDQHQVVVLRLPVTREELGLDRFDVDRPGRRRLDAGPELVTVDPEPGPARVGGQTFGGRPGVVARGEDVLRLGEGVLASAPDEALA